MCTTKVYKTDALAEDMVWREDCLPHVKDLPPNVRGIMQYGVTEMVNNAIDHSGSDQVSVAVIRDALDTTFVVIDEGEGIFLKIQRALGLYDPRESILELAKGKFTTDPSNHTGEGIFFSSRMFDLFYIHSGDLFFSYSARSDDDVLDDHAGRKGTFVAMRIANDSERIERDVYAKYTDSEEFTFAKTVVPVRLAQFEGEKLVSRSQAKRLTRRFDRFQTVMLDFSGVEEIGQAFADEVFRVFALAHPDTQMFQLNASDAILAMISRVTRAVRADL
jgi:hypothetical protein